jgi:hypothetical protein
VNYSNGLTNKKTKYIADYVFVQMMEDVKIFPWLRRSYEDTFFSTWRSDDREGDPEHTGGDPERSGGTLRSSEDRT